MMREEIRHELQKAAHVLFGNIALPDFSVAAPEGTERGDYASNAAFAFSKVVKKQPMGVATEIKNQMAKVKSNIFKKIDVASPGFINFWIKDDHLLQELDNILKNPDQWGTSGVGRGKTAIVEYFQLNIAKRPHIGHLRSAVIGDALKRMLMMSGYRAVSDTHVGDWGTQFGILLAASKKNKRQLEKTETEDPFDALEQWYREENVRIEKDPERREIAKEEFAKLERGDPENRKIWQWMVDISMQKLRSSANRLGLLPFDEHRGESVYEEVMPGIVKFALERNIAKKTEDGAVVVDLSQDKLDEAVLVKSDGASTYLLRDLATIRYRKEKWDFWKNLYVVDVRQSHHFRQVFRVAELLGFEGTGPDRASGAIIRPLERDEGGESRHIAFGFMTLPEGTLSTRKGTTISLDAVLDEAKRLALAVIKEKNPDLPDAERVAEMVGVGALKHFDLSHHRTSDIVFRWDQALSFEGASGPYLQYTHARLKSILRKMENYHSFDNELSGKSELDETEHRLLVSLLRLPEAIEDALSDFTPNTLANYLYALAGLANEFYQSHPVMQESDAMKRGVRFSLVAGVAHTLQRGLWCLGIEAPEEM